MQQTAKTTTPPANSATEEVDYPAQQILASATDFRGVIRYANPAFCDVAKFSHDDLMGAPHKVVRHLDMPRGMFFLFWERLKSGLPVCAYVKNRTGDGRYYWVFATVTQMRDGYISVRIKPTGELFALTRELYSDLLFEEANGLSPEKSAQRLRAYLAEKGYRNFDAYMGAALDSEIGNRSDIAEIAGSTLEHICDLTELIERAETLVNNISSVFGQVRGEPVNLRILAGRLEEAGAVISTISKNYETMAVDMYQLVERLNGDEAGALIRMRDSIDRGRGAAQISALMKLTASQADETDRELLAGQSALLSDASRTAMAEISAFGQTIPDTCRQLRRRINGLDLVKLLCRVESGRIGDVDSGMNGIITRLEEAHQSTDRYLSKLSATASLINSRSKTL
ncbi:MAG: PAS domain-containing protein [Sediminimonas qiaohouensis]|uniref:PAS domain-containing protein n=1 Tax=Sediminimonas qiaohouensis TaxID=552061 RepID=A0A7C9HNQ5_9RHOB|nr:hypothetical protein [Sediminimonas qiaohouensis]MTJ06048.1 PAS domain-containing protein [Sediminimonas qiaohouensis]